VLSDWRKRVEAHATSPGGAAPDLTPGDLTLQQILGPLTVRQAWMGGGAIVTVLGAVATIAYRLGAGA
jgi:hypothetical protein